MFKDHHQPPNYLMIFLSTTTTTTTTPTKAPGTRYENTNKNYNQTPSKYRTFVSTLFKYDHRFVCLASNFSKIMFSTTTTTTKAPVARYAKMSVHTYLIPVRSKQLVLWYPVDTL